MSAVSDAVDAAFSLQQATTNEVPLTEMYFRKEVANILLALAENAAGQTPASSTSPLPAATPNAPVVHRKPG
jgi:hypothetical protein